MPAGDQKQQIGKRDIVGQPRRQRMAFEMIDGNERQIPGCGNGLCRHRTDYHAADQTGPGGRGNPVEIADVEAGLRQRAADNAIQNIEMCARRDFRHDTAKCLVFVILGIDNVRQNTPVVGNYRRRRFIAACLDPKDDHEYWSAFRIQRRNPTAAAQRFPRSRRPGPVFPAEETMMPIHMQISPKNSDRIVQ